MRSEAAPNPITARWPRHIRLQSRTLGFSFRLRLRTLALTLFTVLLAVVAATWTMMLGSFQITLGELTRAIMTPELASDDVTYVVRTLRLPRMLTAVLAGGAFGASGAIFQGLVRNPLVAPDIIGVNAGASLLSVFFIVAMGQVTGAPLAAFGGAVAATFLVYGLTWRKGIVGGRLILVGIGVNAVLAALTTLLIVRYPIEQVSSAVRWQTGTLYASSWQDVTALVVGLATCLPLALWLTRRLSLLQLGDQSAAALGIRVEPVRFGLLFTGAVLASVAVAAGGPIVFVALIAPHIARMLAGPLTGGVLVLSAACGALMLALSDLVAQHAFPVALPVGVVTAAVGAPYFLFLLYRNNQTI